MPLVRRVLLLALLTTTAAFAQETPPPDSGSTPGSTAGTGATSISGQNTIPDPWTAFGGQQGLGVGIGIGKIGGDYWASTQINTDFSIGKVGIGLALPLDILVWNDEDSGCAGATASPQVKCTRDDKAIGGWIRRPSWNEPSDFFKLIRYVRYGHKRDPFYVQVGQQWSASIGHGTIVSRYNNTLNLDYTKVGVALDVNQPFFGFETFTNDVLNPQVIAGRVYVRPLGETPFLSGWAIGLTYAGDVQAPFYFQRDATGNVVADDHGHAIATDARVQSVGGIDMEFAVLDNSLIRLVPYVDFNRIFGAGNGLHAGVFSDIHLPVPIIDVSLYAKLEYRVMGDGYIPAYFDSQYEQTRNTYFFLAPAGVGGADANGNIAAPKALAARYIKGETTGVKQGWYGELAGNIGGFVTIGGTLQDYQDQPGGQIGIYATIPNFSLVKVLGYYTRSNFTGLGEAFKIDDRSLLGGTVAFKVFGPIYLSADFRRQWELDPSGVFTTKDTYQFGAMSLFHF
ncbi:MAG: hypothetical protein JST92_15710 [Deltaproteobacteria bacterium]|nr:hypothetical protein [Deltaproteobacteria bacterium]